MRNVKCTSRAITLHHARSPTQFRYQSREAHCTLCTCFVPRYTCTYIYNSRKEREIEKLETPYIQYIYMYHMKRNRSVCPIPRALSPWYSTTYEHANYPKEFAGVRSFRVSKDLPLSVISFREFSSRISARQKLHHSVNAIIKKVGTLSLKLY